MTKDDVDVIFDWFDSEFEKETIHSIPMVVSRSIESMTELKEKFLQDLDCIIYNDYE